MQQAIIDFHLDEENDWVADLACGHGQHVCGIIHRGKTARG